MADQAAYALCAENIRAGDPDRHAASLFLPPSARPHVWALLAFDLEIAKTRDAVSQPMLGEIRHQWWHEAIAARAPAGNPVAEALCATLDACALDPAPLLALIEARAFDLYDDPMPSLDTLWGYIRATSGAMFGLTQQVLAPGFPPHPAVEAAARAYGLTTLLRALPYQVMRGQLFLPLDVLAKFQLPPDNVLHHENSPALGLVLGFLRAQVRNELKAMEQALPACSAPEACLPALLCAPYLRKMERPGLNPFATPVELSQLRRLWALWRAVRRL